MCEVMKPFRLRSREIAGSDAHNRLLATADPLGGAALEAPAISRAFDLLGQRIVAHAQRSSGRRTRRVGRLALAFAAAAILAGASAGAMKFALNVEEIGGVVTHRKHCASSSQVQTAKTLRC